MESKDYYEMLVKQAYRRGYAEAIIEMLINVIGKTKKEADTYLKEITSTIIELGE